MKNHKNLNDEIYITLKTEITGFPGTFILLKKLLTSVENINSDMPAYLQSPEGQAGFFSAVSRLVCEEIITPVGRKPDTYSGLHLKYRVIKQPEKKDNELIAQIIKNIVLPAKVDYYIKYPQDYIEDREIIEKICKFLKNHETHFAVPLTINERAYELFGDEKFFKGGERDRSRGETVLKRLGLEYADLCCKETIEPFFSFQKKDFHLQNSRNIYIIENKDTFWSFKRNIMDRPSTLKVDMLVYGEGRKILSSFRFVEEYGVNPESDVFIYFGDADPEGINIFCELAEAYPGYKIIPFVEGYKAIIEIGLERPPQKTYKKQRSNRENIKKFSMAFERPMRETIIKYMGEGFYIPQEALSAAKMIERFRKADYD